MRLKDYGFMYSGLTGKSGDDFRCEDLSKTKAFIPFTNILNNFVIDHTQFKQVVMEDGEQQNRVEKGDLLFLMSSEDYESIGKSAVVLGNPGEVYLNSFCRGFRFKHPRAVNSKYVNYQLACDKYRDNLRFEARGFTRINLKIDRVESAEVNLPSLPEQDVIVAYLDEKTAAIDTQVSLLEQKAKKYEQLKKSLISHAVTCGLNSDVRLKESGIDWIGQIPEHWSIVEIKHYCRSIFAGATPSTKEASYWDGDIPWIPSGACHDGIITEFNHTITEEGFANSSTKMIPANTALMAMTGATCANTGYLTFESCANQSVCAYIENKKTCNSKYLFYLLQAARKYILTFQTGGAQAGINLQDCSLLKVPCVPLSEQQTIADYLDKKTAEIDAAIANINQQIEKYKLLRRALINEVVTGQRAI